MMRSPENLVGEDEKNGQRSGEFHEDEGGEKRLDNWKMNIHVCILLKCVDDIY